VSRDEANRQPCRDSGRATRHLALSTRVRMVWGGALVVPVRATRTTEPGGMRPADADVAHAMAGSMARVPAAATRLSVGLTLRI